MTTPKTSRTTPQHRLMLMPSERLYISASEPVDGAVAGEQRADEREHEADWPANIESHKFVPFVESRRMMLSTTQQSSRMTPSTAGRRNQDWSSSLILGVSE